MAASDAVRRPRRAPAVALGLLFTFIGLLLTSLLLPTDPASLGHLLPLAAGAIFLLWVGGILLGRGSRT